MFDASFGGMGVDGTAVNTDLRADEMSDVAPVPESSGKYGWGNRSLEKARAVQPCGAVHAVGVCFALNEAKVFMRTDQRWKHFLDEETVSVLAGRRQEMAGELDERRIHLRECLRIGDGWSDDD